VGSAAGGSVAVGAGGWAGGGSVGVGVGAGRQADTMKMKMNNKLPHKGRWFCFTFETIVLIDSSSISSQYLLFANLSKMNLSRDWIFGNRQYSDHHNLIFNSQEYQRENAVFLLRN
jgi:hypothetical protein